VAPANNTSAIVSKAKRKLLLNRYIIEFVMPPFYKEQTISTNLNKRVKTSSPTKRVINVYNIVKTLNGGLNTP